MRGNQKVALAPRLLLDRLPLATSHLSGDDRRANPSWPFGGGGRQLLACGGDRV